MTPTIEITFQAPFHDIDLLEVVWHGHYYKYFELARTELFRKYDFDVPRIREMGYSMVVIESKCKYINPIRYGMEVIARASIDTSELDYRICINYLLTEKESGRRLAKGSTIHVTMNPKNGTPYMETPEDIRAIFSKPIGEAS